MKLINLKIENFRGLKGDMNNIDFSKSNIIFLIGQNNVGKSTFLRAYEFFINAKQIAKKEDFYNYDVSTPIIMTGTFEKEASDDTDDELSKKDPDWINKWVDNNNFVKIRKEWYSIDQTFHKSTWNPSESSWVQNGFGGLHTKFTTYTPTPIAINAMETEETLEKKVNDLIQKDFLKTLKEEYQDEYQEVIDKIKTIQERVFGTESIQLFNDEINQYFSKVFTDLVLKIEPKDDENIKVEDAIKNSHSIRVVRNGSERKEQFNQYGHGVVRQALFNFLAFLKKHRQVQEKNI